MTSSKSTKRALISSTLAILMCVAMLIGTTFAWFTDTASTAVNKIQAGTLEIELQYATAWDASGVPTAWADAEGKTLNFRKAAGAAANEAILWEPGCTYKLPELRIVNNGNLALQYKILITGIAGDAKLNEVIDWEWAGCSIDENGVYEPRRGGDLSSGDSIFGSLKPNTITDDILISGSMKGEAGNEYQGKSIDGIGITVLATQYTYENDSFGSTYDEDATYGTGATIIGLKGTYDSLTAAAKAWRESKGIATSGGNMGGHPADLTSVDSISWVISGSVGTGDGTGVVGTSGSLLSGGYIYPSVAINNVYIKGVNNAELKNELGSDYALTAGGKNVVYDGITFPEYVSFNSGAENVTFKNCTFKGGLKVMQAINVTVYNCKFEGDGTKDYAFFAQAVPANSMKAVQFNNNTVSGFMRGLNVQAEGAAVTISGNTIKNITGKTGGFTYGSAIQLTRGKTFTVTHNTISDVAVNALHIYNGCDADSIVINDNDITAAYLCWNEANYTNVTSSGNTLNITNPGKCVTKTDEVDSNFAFN